MNQTHFFVSISDFQALLNQYVETIKNVNKRDAEHFLKVASVALDILEGFLLRGELARATIFYTETLALINEAYRDLAIRMAEVQKLRFPIDLINGRAVRRIRDVSDPLQTWRTKSLDPFLIKWELPARG